MWDVSGKGCWKCWVLSEKGDVGNGAAREEEKGEDPSESL